MATLQELMAEVLGGDQSGQTKEAQATKSTTDEIDQVLENLGLDESESVKTASENENTNDGGNMSGLMGIYEEIMGDETGAEKVADSGYEGDDSASTAFGELVGSYFNEMAGPFFDKVASDLEAEAGQGEQPMAHAPVGGSMGRTLGAQRDPHLPVNHSASSGAKLETMTGNSSPYSLAVKQKLLKRMAGNGPVGEYK